MKTYLRRASRADKASLRPILAREGVVNPDTLWTVRESGTVIGYVADTTRIQRQDRRRAFRGYALTGGAVTGLSDDRTMTRNLTASRRTWTRMA